MQLSTIVNNSTALTMSSREIASLTGKQLNNVHRDIRSMLIELYGAEHVEKIVPEQYRNRHSEFIRENAENILNSIVGHDSNRNHQDNRGFSWERDTRGYIKEFNLNKDLTLTLVAGYNVKLRLAIIKRWQELEEKEKLMSKLDTTAEQDIRILSAVSDMLRLSDSGRIGMVRKYIENETPKLKAYLPAYAIDAPTDSTVVGNSSQVTKCATDLLMLHNAKVTTRKLNEMLVEKGFLETQMRPSANKVMKPFKCITEKGLKYGKNLTSDKNQKETQHHWYVNKFTELLNELGL